MPCPRVNGRQTPVVLPGSQAAEVPPQLALRLAYCTNRCAAGTAYSMIFQYKAPYVIPGRRTTTWTRFFWGFQIAAVLFGLVSLGFFVVGMLLVKSAFINL